jgi:hypothetical protein
MVSIGAVGPRLVIRYKLLLFAFVIHSVLSASLQAQRFEAGTTYFGQNGYIEYRTGNLPLIITVPHGGTLEPASIPDRTCGITGIDTRTMNLVREIDYEIFQLTGRYPHIIICHLARIKLDANRDQAEATCNGIESLVYFTEWHSFIDSAKSIIMRDWGKGLSIDLHGHGHVIQRLEWGYLLSGAELAVDDATLDQQSYIEKSSIRSLAGSNSGSLTHSQLLRGVHSLGSLLNSWGIPGVPGNQTPYPGGDPYFSGGYNTLRHGSFYGGTIDAIQLEAHSEIRINHLSRLAFSNRFAISVMDYLRLHYFPAIRDYYAEADNSTGIAFEEYGVPYIQTFDNIFAGDKTWQIADNSPEFPGMYSFRTLGNVQPQEFRRYTTGLSVTGNGSHFNTGSSTQAGDRAMGMIYSSTTGPISFGLRFVNMTGGTIRSVEISFTGEQWRVGGTSATSAVPAVVLPNTLDFDYMVAPEAKNIRNGDYQRVESLCFTSPNTDTLFLQSAIDGNQPGNRVRLSGSFDVDIPPGGELMLRWIDRNDDPGFDHLLAIDDLSVAVYDVATGVRSYDALVSTLNIYPNPVRGTLSFDNMGDCSGSVTIFDITGHIVLQRQVSGSRVHIDVSSQSSGLYLLRLRKADGSYVTMRYIKQ